MEAEIKILMGCMLSRDPGQGRVEVQTRSNKVQANYLPTYSVLLLLSAGKGGVDRIKWIGLCIRILRRGRLAAGLRRGMLIPVHRHLSMKKIRHL